MKVEWFHEEGHANVGSAGSSIGPSPLHILVMIVMQDLATFEIVSTKEPCRWSLRNKLARKLF